jgi:peptidoglycan L-alanyl-D-glutamate endopeptidase CwlK
MNPLDHADTDFNKLYPPFRIALRATLDEVEQATHEPWIVVEGYRSQARQTWLYGQGRSRPGREVTWVTEPKWHGTGLAADVMPSHKAYAAPRAWWEQLQAIGRRHGLHDPPWVKGDLGHLQLDVPEDGAVHVAAMEWARKGFPAMPDTPHPQTETAKLIWDGREIPTLLTSDGHGHLVLGYGGESMHVRNLAAAFGMNEPIWTPGPPQVVTVTRKP